jgi:hypothetical protein
MTFTILIRPFDDQFAAALVGAPEVQVVGPTRQQAIEGLRSAVAERVARGELLSLEVGSLGVTGLAGNYAGDPTLPDIVAEAYRARDTKAPASL